MPKRDPNCKHVWIRKGSGYKCSKCRWFGRSNYDVSMKDTFGWQCPECDEILTYKIDDYLPTPVKECCKAWLGAGEPSGSRPVS